MQKEGVKEVAKQGLEYVSLGRRDFEDVQENRITGYRNVQLSLSVRRS
jgi:hypothetical protein